MRIHWSAKCRCSLTKRPTRWPSATLTLRPTVMAVSATYAYDTASPAPSSKRRPVTLNETRNSENTSAWHASEKKTNKQKRYGSNPIHLFQSNDNRNFVVFINGWIYRSMAPYRKEGAFQIWSIFHERFWFNVFFNENKNKSYIKIPVET